MERMLSSGLTLSHGDTLRSPPRRLLLKLCSHGNLVGTPRPASTTSEGPIARSHQGASASVAVRLAGLLPIRGLFGVDQTKAETSPKLPGCLLAVE